ncbi:hypothetical protein [Rickettsia hoogstraalii]|uniref:hypothetical protein n=1 Tax=Rickettsia hoogstraalii TaxID=467174 RepID=UPI000A3F93BB|nr:hypothetical protein [Rickettsia hoogstraalii]
MRGSIFSSLREELRSNSTKQSRAKFLRLPRRCYASPRNDGSGIHTGNTYSQ